MDTKFHDRFDISVDIKEAKNRFLNRVYNRVFSELFYRMDEYKRRDILRSVAYELGLQHISSYGFHDYIGRDFYKCLQALEAFYRSGTGFTSSIQSTILQILSDSEIDLGIRWEKGRFIKSGAKLLDNKLVNEPLRWLGEKSYQSILEPYSKGLEHFLQSEQRPQLLADVITDMYEALEALAKIVTGRETKDLTANAQLFLKEVGSSEAYKSILKEYISYANNFRHATTESARKPIPTYGEVESFIYLTGIFIRLVIQKGSNAGSAV